MEDAWSPDQYHRFARQRRRPVFDLLRTVPRRAGMAILDLGCGPGEITSRLARWFPGATVVGVDSSPRMLDRARAFARPGLTFRAGRIEEVRDLDRYDLVFSNAALQWVPDHERAFPALLSALRPGARFAIQMPANHDHLSHRLARTLAAEAPFAEALGGFVRTSPVLPLARYAELMDAAGVECARAVVKVYGHPLARTREVIAWTRGTTLTPYLARLGPEARAAFLEAYGSRLLEALGDRAPYFYAFPRMLLTGVAGRCG